MNRREFIADVAATAVVGLAASRARAVDAGQRATVVAVHRAGTTALAPGERVAALRQMLDTGLTRLTGQSGAAAWQRFCSAGDTVGLKINALAPHRPTSPELAEAVAMGVVSAGVAPERCWVFDRFARELTAAGYKLGVQPAGYRVVATDESDFGWEPQALTFGQATQQVSCIVARHLTSLINVPIAKDHNVCGVTGAIKNHAGNIRQPQRLHADHGVGFADCAALPPFVQKQKLVIGDALTIIFEGGPGDRPDCRQVLDTVLLATDPVAHDVVLWQMIEAVRAQKGLRPLAKAGRPTTHLQVAASAPRSLGFADPALIELVRIELS